MGQMDTTVSLLKTFLMNTTMSPPPSFSNIEKLAAYRRILLLQGPLGNFFQQLAQWLKSGGSQVYKINFSGGDNWDYPEIMGNVFDYTGMTFDFADYVKKFLQQHQIDAVVCFGDTRAYHVIAQEVCQTLNISFWVFEEGYFRPFWVTLEEHGVNAFSMLPRDGAFFQAAYPQLKQKVYQEPAKVKGGFLPMAWVAIQHYTALFFDQARYPHYRHHRQQDFYYYLKCWLRSGWRYVWYKWRNRPIAKMIQQGKMGRFYIFPLQVATDSQIRVHSDYASMRNGLLDVLGSFAVHAPKDTKLIVKHHPLDRGFTNYRKTIERFIETHPDVAGRIFYVHDIPLPVFLRTSIGMVTVNSTSGLSALLHHLPTKVLGRANYDIIELASRKSLAQFWKEPRKPNEQLFHAYRMYHINYTQIHGNFYTQVNLPPNPYQK